jgi:hypothetical protein
MAELALTSVDVGAPRRRDATGARARAIAFQSARFFVRNICDNRIYGFKLSGPFGDERLVFPDPRTGEPRKPDTFSNEFLRAVKISGLPKVSFHGLRHSYASISLRAATPLKVVSMLGHRFFSLCLHSKISIGKPEHRQRRRMLSIVSLRGPAADRHTDCNVRRDFHRPVSMVRQYRRHLSYNRTRHAPVSPIATRSGTFARNRFIGRDAIVRVG